jgi:hypothetical protein
MALLGERRFSLEQCRSILRDYELGTRLRPLARKYFCDKQTIKEAIQRAGGKYVTDRSKPNWKGVGELSGAFWCALLAGARKRGIEVSISIEDAWAKFLGQKGACAYSGRQLKIGQRCKGASVRYGSASLDRIDSTKGYILGNVHWIHKDLNLMKLDLSESEFLSWCRAVVEHRGGLNANCRMA